MKRLTKQVRVWCATGLAMAAGIMAAAGAPVDAFDVAWDTPGTNHHGSMPLGNGDVALNAWMSNDGDLHFYISKTDAWDDNARLVKVGKVRVHFTQSLLEPGRSFHQELKLAEGCIEFKSEDAKGGDPATVRLWVDANHPVIQITAEGARPFEATAFVELWRTNRQELVELQTSDVMLNRKAPGKTTTENFIEPDVVLGRQSARVGWYHHNIKSVGPQILAELQGLTGFQQADPLLGRTFGAVITAAKGKRLDDLRLQSPRGKSHRFNVFVLTRHPSTPKEWVGEMDRTIREVEGRSFAERRVAHEGWWREFWNRSWIRASVSTNTALAEAPLRKAGSGQDRIPANKHEVRIGMDQQGANRFSGEIGRISVYGRALGDREIQELAKRDRHEAVAAGAGLLFTGVDAAVQVISNSAAWDFSSGLTIEAWVNPGKLGGGGARLLDKITAGSRDGFLFDTHPGNSLRLICGQVELDQAEALPAGQWTHVAAVVGPSGQSRMLINGLAAGDSPRKDGRDEAARVSQMYHLQRFITACAGRGAYPIKFNGSLFTVPPGPTEADPDYRRWGPGYWWQNTRLPYISLSTSGDFDLQRPLFHMYADELLPLCKYRTKLYLNHEGAFYPECIMFWGAVFSETYGWTPFSERVDKLQESGWHKWEWVGGLELCWMMLDYYSHTLDARFLRETALPFSREILTFFNQHYPLNGEGRLVMHPSQALETWWKCTNAAPEVAGCIAVADRLLALPARVVPAADRALWQQLRARLPEVPVREIDGRKALAPAEFFAQKSNVENPELYPVFPFRLFAFNRPNPDWAITALEHRSDRGHSGWRQDDIFMAYLGLTGDARAAVLSRAGSHDAGERFPAFWGPNYDWTPDQDHGGVLMKAFQSMLLQTDGQKIFLLPAWPANWNVDFKLHAPQRTTIEGSFRDGRMQSLRVTPESRRADLTVLDPNH